MFSATLVYMLMLAMVLHRTESESSQFFSLFALLCVTYVVFPLELVLRVFMGASHWRQYALFCLVPPLRLVARNQNTGSTVWFPRMGWREVDDALFRTMEKAFGIPMIFVALLIIPLLSVEFYFYHIDIKPSPVFRLCLDIGTALVWMGFAIEFFVMFSLANKRVRYCKEHWLDVLIICLPLIGFIRLLRLGGLLRLKQLTRLSRLYRLRGLAVRAYRAIMLIDLINLVMQGNEERRLRRLQELLQEHEVAIEDLETQICKLKKIIAEKDAEATQVQSVECEE